MAIEMHTHPLTGHDCCYPKPDMWKLPERFTVDVHRGDPDGGDMDTWYADIKGECPDGKPFDQVTFGETPVHALFMAYDVVRMLWDECDVSGAGDGARQAKHCYCRDVTATGAFPMAFSGGEADPTPRAAKQCCRCTQVTAITEFEP